MLIGGSNCTHGELFKAPNQRSENPLLRAPLLAAAEVIDACIAFVSAEPAQSTSLLEHLFCDQECPCTSPPVLQNQEITGVEMTSLSFITTGVQAADMNEDLWATVGKICRERL